MSLGVVMGINVKVLVAKLLIPRVGPHMAHQPMGYGELTFAGCIPTGVLLCSCTEAGLKLMGSRWTIFRNHPAHRLM